MQYSNQFALSGWSWIVLSYRVQRNVITSDLGQSYLLPTRANDVSIHWREERTKEGKEGTVRLSLVTAYDKLQRWLDIQVNRRSHVHN